MERFFCSGIKSFFCLKLTLNKLVGFKTKILNRVSTAPANPIKVFYLIINMISSFRLMCLRIFLPSMRDNLPSNLLPLPKYIAQGASQRIGTAGSGCRVHVEYPVHMVFEEKESLESHSLKTSREQTETNLTKTDNVLNK